MLPAPSLTPEPPGAAPGSLALAGCDTGEPVGPDPAHRGRRGRQPGHERRQHRLALRGDPAQPERSRRLQHPRRRLCPRRALRRRDLRLQQGGAARSELRAGLHEPRPRLPADQPERPGARRFQPRRSRPTRITAPPISAAAICCARRVLPGGPGRPDRGDPPDAGIGRGASCPRAPLPASGRPPAGDPRLRRRHRPQPLRCAALRRPRPEPCRRRTSSTRRSRISTRRSTSTTATANPGPGAASPTSARAAARKRSRATSARRRRPANATGKQGLARVQGGGGLFRG